MEDGTDPSSAFLDALRTRAMDEMHEAALEYGIVLKDLGLSRLPSLMQKRILTSSIQLSSIGNSRVTLPQPWINSLPVPCKHKWRLPYVFCSQV
jgi:hypothetical protein